MPNYRVHVSFDGERKLFVARAPELSHCSGEGATRAEAIAKVEEEIEAQIQNIRAQGGGVPTAVDEESWSGEIAAKVSRTLHRDLAWQARSEGIDVDQLVGELLAAALEGRRGVRGQRAGNRPPAEHVPNDNIGNAIGGGGRPNRGYGPRYQGILDDRANFIEYVRGLETGGGGPNRMGGGPGPGPGGGGGRRRRRGRGGGNGPMGGSGPMGGGGGGNGNGPGPNGNGGGGNRP
jgi:predicted RNase H-like HicB family nuclease